MGSRCQVAADIGCWVAADIGDIVVTLPAFAWSSLVGSVVEDKKAAEFGKAAAQFRWCCAFSKLIRAHLILLR